MTYEFTDQYDRSDNDWYVEPRWCIERLIENVKFEGVIHDPACGAGKIPKTFNEHGYATTGSDIKDRGYGEIQDFFRDIRIRDNIVTNPPYNLSERFIDCALHITIGRVAILARIAFLNGQKRYRTLYSVHLPEKVIILSQRPSMPPGGRNIIPEGGKTDFCWIVWNKTHNGPCELVWAL
jgi:hypothetical protein